MSFTLPAINRAQDAAAVASAVLAAMASGEITPTDAAEVSKLIDSYVKAYETAELAERLERLEGMTGRCGIRMKTSLAWRISLVR